jgi:hypothetical protein
VSKVAGRTESGAKPGRPGRLIGVATRWAVISWTGFSLLAVLCLVDIVGLGSALTGVGLQWLVGMSVIVLATTTARLTLWVGRDVCRGLRTEVESLVRSLNPARWKASRRRNSGVWDAWLDDPVPGRS